MATRPEVWFAIPSANPALCRANLPAWRDMGYRVAVLQNHEDGDIPADLVRWSNRYPGWGASINLLCAQVVPKSACIVVSGGDDMLPDPHHRADDLAEQFLDHFGGTFGVMQPSGDGFLGAGTYCGSPWLGRQWIDCAYAGAGPMPGGYHHNWADGDLYWVARCLGALWMRGDVSQRHEHFTRTGDVAPDYWHNHVAGHDRADVQLFLSRAWQRFPGCEPTGTEREFDSDIFDREYDHRAETHWIARYGRELATSEPHHRLGAALTMCAQEGMTRVAIFGAGSHTRLAADALMDPPVRIVCVIDDDDRLNGRRLWNYPVVSRAQFDPGQVDGVVISSRSCESHLAQLAEVWRDQGIQIVTLYAPEGEHAGTIA